ncbi:MAG: SIMPL domain-containing protein [Candidatus Omnitrophota bacterium]
MEKGNFFKNSQIVVLGVCIAVATIVSAIIFSQGLMKIMKFRTEVISVTGGAEKKIVSDYMVWGVDFSRRDAAMTAAYAKLKEDLKVITDYLVSKGIASEEIVASQIGTEVFYKKSMRTGKDTNDIEYYKLSQRIEVRSYDIQKVTDTSRESTELIDKGIEIISNPPQYFYTKLSDLKIEMLRAATKDAKKRAEEIASSSGNRIGVIRSARMGVFQITPVNSYDVSDYGENDTSSLEKKVNAVVKAEFAIL